MATAPPSGERVVPDPSSLDFTTRSAASREELPIIAARPRDRLPENQVALVLDSEAAEARWTADALASLGLHPVMESTLQGAARHIAVIGPPRLVVIELDIPKALGFVVSLRRRERLRDVAVVAYTWRGDRGTLLAALRADVDGCVIKTGDREPLLRAVRRILRMPASEGAMGAAEHVPRYGV